MYKKSCLSVLGGTTLIWWPFRGHCTAAGIMACGCHPWAATTKLTCDWSHFAFTITLWMRVIFTILEMRKQVWRGEKELARGHSVGEWQSFDLNLSLCLYSNHCVIGHRNQSTWKQSALEAVVPKPFVFCFMNLIDERYLKVCQTLRKVPGLWGNPSKYMVAAVLLLFSNNNVSIDPILAWGADK